MRPTKMRRTADAPSAAEHRHRSDISWKTLGIATATEHGALSDAAIATERSRAMRGNISSDGPGHGVVSIGSVRIRPHASNEPATRALEWVMKEINSRLHVYTALNLFIGNDEIRNWCSRSATEQTDTPAPGRIPDYYYRKKSWSDTLEAISLCVAAYQNAIAELEAAGLENIMNKMKRHTQALHEKCVQDPYLQEDIVDSIADYIWNRSCNVVVHMLIDDTLTSEELRHQLSEQEFDYALNLMEKCAGCLETYRDEIIAELINYRA